MSTAQAATPTFLLEPNTAFWEITRERAILLAAPRILLLQVAHPLIAASVAEHSYVFQNPVRRLQRTLDLTMNVIFGTEASAAQALGEIETVHRAATGRIQAGVGSHAAGTTYNPRNPRQALWVYATLIEGALMAYQQFIRPLDATTREQYYQQSKPFAHVMGVRPTYLPVDYAGLLQYMDDAITSGEVQVGDEARAIAQFLTGQSLPLVNFVMHPPYRLTVGLLPTSLRAQYGYQFSQAEGRWLERFSEMTRWLIPNTPHELRFWHAYQKAQRLLHASRT